MNHSFEPLADVFSEILILGSFPSVISLQEMQYYGNKHNRFWKLMSQIYHAELNTYEEKAALLICEKIALWDVIAFCHREGSLDSDIKDAMPNDIGDFLKSHPKITKILCNGKTSGKLYERYFARKISLPYLILPSTSPANAAYSLDDLLVIWLPAVKNRP